MCVYTCVCARVCIHTHTHSLPLPIALSPARIGGCLGSCLSLNLLLLPKHLQPPCILILDHVGIVFDKC